MKPINYQNVLNILSNKQIAYLAQDAAQYVNSTNDTNSKGLNAWRLLVELCECDYSRVYPIATAYCHGFNY